MIKFFFFFFFFKAPHPLKDESVHNDLVSTNRLRCSLVANNPQICDVLRRDLSADEMYSNAEEGNSKEKKSCVHILRIC